jgi:hypothetical protein
MLATAQTGSNTLGRKSIGNSIRDWTNAIARIGCHDFILGDNGCSALASIDTCNGIRSHSSNSGFAIECYAGTRLGRKNEERAISNSTEQ